MRIQTQIPIFAIAACIPRKLTVFSRLAASFFPATSLIFPHENRLIPSGWGEGIFEKSAKNPTVADERVPDACKTRSPLKVSLSARERLAPRRVTADRAASYSKPSNERRSFFDRLPGKRNGWSTMLITRMGSTIGRVQWVARISRACKLMRSMHVAERCEVVEILQFRLFGWWLVSVNLYSYEYCIFDVLYIFWSVTPICTRYSYFCEFEKIVKCVSRIWEKKSDNKQTNCFACWTTNSVYFEYFTRFRAFTYVLA